jgi:hypothetical protein
MNWDQYFAWHLATQLRSERKLQQTLTANIPAPRFEVKELDSLQLNYNARAKLDLTGMKPRGILVSAEA